MYWQNLINISNLYFKGGSISANVGLGVGFDGSLGVGYGIFISSSEGTFLTTNNYKMTVDKDTYEKMKKDHSLVFDYCVSAINEKDFSANMIDEVVLE